MTDTRADDVPVASDIDKDDVKDLDQIKFLSKLHRRVFQFADSNPCFELWLSAALQGQK